MTPLLLAEPSERFLAEDHVATLTTLRPDRTAHVVPVRFTWDASAGLVRVMTIAARRKTRNIVADPDSRATICQVAGFRWITLEGPAAVFDNPARIAEAVRRYTARYGSPPPMPDGLVVIEITVDRVLSLNN
ncbi:pyridoxamine 5'-phosphate oxidase family protein [Nocardia sp. CA-119907]|uniref:pyridoxamine 5'-phosphate oxidase family protein n=1 Tax=Nocardia sp. CA-119907 TaxID=3239973 RepID=UPI003D968E94